MRRSLEIIDVGLPVALVLRLTTVAVTLVLARRASWCRRVALGGSIVASAVTVAVSIRVLASGTAVDGVLLRHVASAIVFGYSITSLSAWFLPGAGPRRGAGRGVQPTVSSEAVRLGLGFPR